MFRIAAGCVIETAPNFIIRAQVLKIAAYAVLFVCFMLIMDLLVVSVPANFTVLLPDTYK